MYRFFNTIKKSKNINKNGIKKNNPPDFLNVKTIQDSAGFYRKINGFYDVLGIYFWVTFQ